MTRGMARSCKGADALLLLGHLLTYLPHDRPGCRGGIEGFRIAGKQGIGIIAACQIVLMGEAVCGMPAHGMGCRARAQGVQMCFPLRLA